MNSTQAELYGCVKAMVMSIRTNVTLDGDKILLQCDNLTAIKAVLDWHRFGHKKGYIDFRSELYIPALRAMDKIIRPRKIEIIVKHVKGHQGNITPRNAVNEMCDKLAKRGLAEARRNYYDPV